MAEAGLDRAVADEHVSARLGDFRRPARIAVSKGLNQNVGKFLFDGLGDGVDKAQQQPARAALLFVDCRAPFAAAVTVVVVLGDVDDADIRFFPQLSQHVLRDDFQNVGVCQAELAARRVRLVPSAGDPPPPPERIVLRLIGKIFFRRAEARKGVAAGV